MKNLTESEFETEVLAAKGKVLVDFWAPWCGPCRSQAPILEQFAAEVPSVKTVKVDVDEAGGIAARYGVVSIPTLMLFEDGKPVDTVVGLTPLDELKTLFGN